MDKKELDRIIRLSDGLSVEKVSEEFQKLLSLSVLDNREDSISLLTAYYEVSDRQWNTFEFIDAGLKEKIDKVIFELWDRDSLESTELVLSIIPLLGLGDSYKRMKAELNSVLNSDVRAEIEDAVNEFGDDITGPYKGMK